MIKIARIDDVHSLSKLAKELWVSDEICELECEFKELINNRDSKIFIKYENNIPIGFAQCQLRHDYVEGTSTSPVGYLEGIYIKEQFRHNGFAKELLLACENWSKEKGCVEFASDCEINNENSLKFHLAMNFQESNRIICFKKSI